MEKDIEALLTEHPFFKDMTGPLSVAHRRLRKKCAI